MVIFKISDRAAKQDRKEKGMNIYINGRKASKQDLALLVERCKRGLEVLKDIHKTRGGGIAIITA